MLSMLVNYGSELLYIKVISGPKFGWRKLGALIFCEFRKKYVHNIVDML